MPIYGNKTYQGGFYNNTVVNGANDRAYNAEDMRKPYDTVFTDGLKPDADGTAGDFLKVSLVGGSQISVATGHAKLGGAWFENKSPFYITLDTAGATDRYDCVIIRNDDSDAVRAPSIYIKSLSRIPTTADLTRNDDIYEICVGYVKVAALATSLSASNITDTRDTGDLCPIMSGVGAMVVRTFNNTVYSTTSGQTSLAIGIPQYNKSRDILIVSVNGRVFKEGTEYTVPSNTHITLTLGLPVIGTKVDFQVLKNVNAAGAETVVQEVAQIRGEVTANNKILEHHYYCNGANDNVLISNLVTNLQNGLSDYSSVRLCIHGHLGATAPRGGAGTGDNYYYWFRLAQGAASNRKVIVDFTDCEEIRINCAENTYNIIFFGFDPNVVGANVIASGGNSITMFSAAGGTSIFCENSRFWVTTAGDGKIARSGTFKNCRASVTCATGHSYCFAPHTASLLRVDGGEYYAYTGSSEHVSAVVGATSGADAVAIMYGVNVPTVARSGFFQTHSVYQTAGIVNCTDLISALPLNVVSGSSNIRGTIAKSKAGLM